MAARVINRTRVTARPNPHVAPPPRPSARGRVTVRDHRSSRRPTTGVVRTRMFYTSAMSLEDRLAHLLFRLTQKFDEKIGRQMRRIQALEENGKLDGKTFAKGGLDDAKGDALQRLNGAMDREMFKLKRLTEKRKQLFDTIAKTIEVFDRTAQNAINSIRAG